MSNFNCQAIEQVIEQKLPIHNCLHIFINNNQHQEQQLITQTNILAYLIETAFFENLTLSTMSLINLNVNVTLSVVNPCLTTFQSCYTFKDVFVRCVP